LTIVGGLGPFGLNNNSSGPIELCLDIRFVFRLFLRLGVLPFVVFFVDDGYLRFTKAENSL
jgi:hypothetical protein